FNGHRIHYDLDYVTRPEGYSGLVVHGPLIATIMLQACVDANPRREVDSFHYRGLRPLIAPAAFEVAGALQDDGTAVLWAEQGGTLAHPADLPFNPCGRPPCVQCCAPHSSFRAAAPSVSARPC